MRREGIRARQGQSKAAAAADWVKSRLEVRGQVGVRTSQREVSRECCSLSLSLSLLLDWARAAFARPASCCRLSTKQQLQSERKLKVKLGLAHTTGAKRLWSKVGKVTWQQLKMCSASHFGGGVTTRRFQNNTARSDDNSSKVAEATYSFPLDDTHTHSLFTLLISPRHSFSTRQIKQTSTMLKLKQKKWHLSELSNREGAHTKFSASLAFASYHHRELASTVAPLFNSFLSALFLSPKMNELFTLEMTSVWDS